VILFRGFGKDFGAHRAVDSLTLEVGRGEAVALLGPNGSGKTTSLKAAAGLVRPSRGDVLLGAPGRPSSEHSARRILSYLPQRVAFPEALSGRETLEFYRALRGSAPERVDEVLKFASLNGAGARAVGTYSGGMVQRLGLAVAMLPDAPVLLLDEPTAALDPDGLCAFYGVVSRHRAEGKTILFTSHQLGDVERLADRIVVLVEGKLVASLTARELADRLSDRGRMRVRIGGSRTDLLGAVRGVSPDAVWMGDDLVVPGHAASRPAVLDALRAAGAEIRAIVTEEGRLDDLYRDLVDSEGRTS
jgi:Cu-processing system ATP-binding protein